MSRTVAFALALIVAATSAAPSIARGGNDGAAFVARDDIPDEVRQLVGTYVGEWKMFGLDAAGNVVVKMAWTDRQVAAEPTRVGDRAFVKTNDEMVFAGVPGPPRKFAGIEGHFIAADGTVGAHFIENGGQVTTMVAIADDVSSYVTPAAPQELAQLGFGAGAHGQHVLVKVVTTEEGRETHRITRVTTVQQRGADGKERCTQLVTLQGFHRREE